MNINLQTVKVGEVLGIARTGSWSVMLEGIHIVTKVNKVRITLTSPTTGNTRTFSVRSGNELSEFGSPRTFLMSEFQYNNHLTAELTRREREKAINTVRSLSAALGKHVSTAEISTIKEAIAKLEEYAIEI